jgi:two-component system, OmpR family, response regulator MprA
MLRVLLVDDDRDLIALLARGFRYEGFDVCTALSGRDGLELASAGDCDVVVLDIGMPGLDGFGVLRRLRLRSDVPVVMLTARDDVDDKVAALGVGADDYLAKPFSFDELVARVRAVLRRRRPEAAGRLRYADLVCDLATREVVRGGRAIELTGRELDVLAHLLAHPRQVVSRESFLRAVWGYPVEVETNVVDVHIGRLRRKLGEPPLIRTVWGVGFALRAEQ